MHLPTITRLNEERNKEKNNVQSIKYKSAISHSDLLFMFSNMNFIATIVTTFGTPVTCNLGEIQCCGVNSSIHKEAQPQQYDRKDVTPSYL